MTGAAETQLSHKCGALLHARTLRLLLMAIVLSCGDDESEPANVTGAPATGGSAGTGGSDLPRGTAGTTNAGGGTGADGGMGGTTATGTGGSGGAGLGGTAGVSPGGTGGTAESYFCADNEAAGAGGLSGGGGGSVGVNITAACYTVSRAGNGGSGGNVDATGNCKVTASANNDSPSGEGPPRAFDGFTGPPPVNDTKWLTFWAPVNGRAPVENNDPEVWIQVELPGPAAAQVMTHYALVSANDRYARDPRDWQLLGSHEGKDWQVLDTRCGVNWPTVDLEPPEYDKFQVRKRFYRLYFTAAMPGAYTFYRLLIGNNAGDRDTIHHNGITQLGELELYTAAPQ